MSNHPLASSDQREKENSLENPRGRWKPSRAQLRGESWAAAVGGCSSVTLAGDNALIAIPFICSALLQFQSIESIVCCLISCAPHPGELMRNQQEEQEQGETR